MMDFERQIVLDSLDGSSLVVLARGLGLHRSMASLLKLHCEPSGLVLVLNAYPAEEYFMMEQLDRERVSLVPKSVTSDFTAKDREALYLKGGVLFVSSQIIVMDILRKCCPVDKVSGIMVYHADKVTELTMEAFILRLFRERNKTGFIHGFSDNPEAFAGEMFQVDHVMKCLFARHLYLWPRFHAAVKGVLDLVKPDVREVHVRLSARMEQVQFALVELIKLTLEQLGKRAPAIRGFDKTQLTVESCLFRNFSKSLRLQLDSVWMQVSQKAKSLIEDLSTLRHLLLSLLERDCVTFWSELDQIKREVDSCPLNQPGKHEWLFMHPVDSLLTAARERVYGAATGGEGASPSRLELEDNPKWSVLADIVAEAKKEQDTGSILVVASSKENSAFLQGYLDGEGRERLEQLYQDLVLSSPTGDVQQNKPRFFNSRIHYVPPDKRPKLSNPTNTLDKCFNKHPPSESASPSAPPASPLLKFVTHQSLLYSHQAGHILAETRPDTVVLYQPELSWVRQLECYQALNPQHTLKVHFLLYKDSMEEQRFLSTLRQEKEAFESLVKQKSLMVVPEDREGKDASCTYLSRDPSCPVPDLFTHIRGGAPVKKERKIIVDVREFKSILPALIHKRGIDIEPVSLEVGDYILSPEVCVERKAVADLIQSLTTGRLYNQCTAMCRYYASPVLMIEARGGECLCLEKSAQGTTQDVAGRLVLLTIHFPRLRVCWCENPQMAAELFDRLKQNKPEPDAGAAQGIGADLDLFAGERYLGGSGVEDFLLKLPGVSYRNYKSLLKGVESLEKLASLSQEKVTSLIGEEDGTRLYKFLHKTV